MPLTVVLWVLQYRVGTDDVGSKKFIDNVTNRLYERNLIMIKLLKLRLKILYYLYFQNYLFSS